MSKLETITIDTPSGSNTMQIGSTNTATINLGVSGDTINVPAGVTIANAGTATGFGETNTPAWFVRYNGEQNLSDYTTTKVTWNVEELDTNSAFASDKFTVPSGGAGKYIIFTSLQMKGDNNDRLIKTDLHIYKNGSSVAYAHDDFRSDNSRQATRMIQTIQTLAESDYIEVYTAVDISAGTPYYEGNNNRALFGGFRIAT